MVTRVSEITCSVHSAVRKLFCSGLDNDKAGKRGISMTKEAMIKVLRYKAEHIKTKIKPEFFAEVADMLEQEPCNLADKAQGSEE